MAPSTLYSFTYSPSHSLTHSLYLSLYSVIQINPLLELESRLVQYCLVLQYSIVLLRTVCHTQPSTVQNATSRLHAPHRLTLQCCWLLVLTSSRQVRAVEENTVRAFAQLAEKYLKFNNRSFRMLLPVYACYISSGSCVLTLVLVLILIHLRTG